MERQTRQRETIVTVIREANRPVSPQEILDLAAKRLPRLGVATVYRAIRQLVAEGELTPVGIPGEAPRYEPAGKAHHHHFHCRKCDRVFEMDGCPGPLQAMAPKGFKVEGHDILLYGLCDRCRR
jgi:Fur family ferric uptake transcriptional regulator